ncbi:Sec-independent protein translocase subunit TatA [Zhongshania sp.]|jgi:sec-independent protein translocase protein TatA|uniref:Sec-independent protein translocase subunit TatA n=1 Tax=Zhongshania sp. TaxID=1971902 RepID=UPI0039E30C05
MGLGGIGIWQLLVVLAIIVMVFGTKRLKGIGGNLGGAIKGFKDSLQGNSDKGAPPPIHDSSKAKISESAATDKK